MGNLAGLISGLLSGGGATVDMSRLYDTIQKSGTYARDIINALPTQIQQNLAQYVKSQNTAGQTYQGQVQGQNADFLSKISSLYGPNSEAANAENAANKKNIYSTVPGTQDAIRNAMAATGGLARGNAGVALAQPYVQAAGQYGSAAAGVAAKQTAQQQQATQQALTIVNQYDQSMFQEMFGMSKEQALQILQTGNQTLRDQLSQLITENNVRTGQMLGAEGIEANNGYQNAVANKENENQMIGSGINLGLSGTSAGFTGMGGWSGISQGLGMGGLQGMPSGADVTSSGYQRNAGIMQPW